MAAPAASEELQSVELVPDDRAGWTLTNLFAPITGFFLGGPGYWYSPRRVEIRTTPPGASLDLFYVRRSFQKAFEQADASIAQRFGGLGLGLAISKSLIDMHGGKIRAASKGIGHGCTFTVELLTTDAVQRRDAERQERLDRRAVALHDVRQEVGQREAEQRGEERPRHRRAPREQRQPVERPLAVRGAKLSEHPLDAAGFEHRARLHRLRALRRQHQPHRAAVFIVTPLNDVAERRQARHRRRQG